MARAPKHHTPAFRVAPKAAAITKGTTTVVEVPGQKHDRLTLEALPHGGFAVVARGHDGDYVAGPLASFTTLDEMLTWVRQNMAQPAMEGTS